jgi:hypothetical protein
LAPEQFKSELEKAEFWSKLYETINGRMQSDGGSGNGEGEGLPKEKTQEEQDAEARQEAINSALTSSGDNKLLTQEEYNKQKEAYEKAKGSGEEFDKKLAELGINIGSTKTSTYTGEKVGDRSKGVSIFNTSDLASGKKDEGIITYGGTNYHLTADGKSKKSFTNTDA